MVLLHTLYHSRWLILSSTWKMLTDKASKLYLHYVQLPSSLTDPLLETGSAYSWKCLANVHDTQRSSYLGRFNAEMLCMMYLNDTSLLFMQVLTTWILYTCLRATSMVCTPAISSNGIFDISCFARNTNVVFRAQSLQSGQKTDSTIQGGITEFTPTRPHKPGLIMSPVYLFMCVWAKLSGHN